MYCIDIDNALLSDPATDPRRTKRESIIRLGSRKVPYTIRFAAFIPRFTDYPVARTRWRAQFLLLLQTEFLSLSPSLCLSRSFSYEIHAYEFCNSPREIGESPRE